MRLISILAYVADAGILGSYAWCSRWPQRLRWFHAANAVGFLPLVAVETAQRAWPVLPLTLTFGVAGAYGWWHTRPPKRAQAVTMTDR
jgi:hypothetical protein